jgi:hypothetical protein
MEAVPQDLENEMWRILATDSGGVEVGNHHSLRVALVAVAGVLLPIGTMTVWFAANVLGFGMR